ncbi:hypothetical protein G6011_06560 [Alternaria panax]|uniref:Uncharacterized protein n=1 Tax=Alternaria panax TaxID=48097 RepID=A0AAD4FH15_9PLEO|nr:hypothetical protein G6011_06560 [Alternaria panax]
MPSNDTPGTLTHFVHHGGNEETRARILIDEDDIPPLTIWGGPTHTTNGFSQPLRPVIVYDHTQTPSTIQYAPKITINHQPTFIYNPQPMIAPSSSPAFPPRQHPSRIVIRNDTEEPRRTYIPTQILENTRPPIRPGNIATIVEKYTRSLAEAKERVTANAEDIPPRLRLSMPEMNQAIGNWGNVVHTREGPVLRLRSERQGHEFRLRRRANEALNGDSMANSYAKATQISHPSESTARVVDSPTPESSTRSSRSASLSGTTLVNSTASLSLDNDTAVVPNVTINGVPSENVDISCNNAYETPAASLRRRRAVHQGKPLDRMRTRKEAAEDARWGLRDRRRDGMEVEMIRHVLGQERAVQAEQTHRAETNGVESEGSEELSDGSVADAGERRLASE